MSRLDLNLYEWWDKVKTLDLCHIIETIELNVFQNNFMIRRQDAEGILSNLEPSFVNKDLLNEIFHLQSILPMESLRIHFLSNDFIELDKARNFMIEFEAESLHRVLKLLNKRLDQLRKEKIKLLITNDLKIYIHSLLQNRVKLTVYDLIKLMNEHLKDWKTTDFHVLIWSGLCDAYELHEALKISGKRDFNKMNFIKHIIPFTHVRFYYVILFNLINI